MKPRMKAYELNSMPSHARATGRPAHAASACGETSIRQAGRVAGRLLTVSHQGMAPAARVAPNATASPDTLQITAHSGMRLRALPPTDGRVTRRKPPDGRADTVGRHDGIVDDLDRRSEEHTSELQSHSDLVCR